MDYSKLITFSMFRLGVSGGSLPFTIVLFVSMMLIFGATEALSQQSPAIVRKLTLAQVKETVSNQGWPITEEDGALQMLITKIEGRSVGITLNKTGERLSLIGFIKLDPVVMSSERIHLFNKTLRGSATTFVDEASLGFASTLELEGGVTRERIGSFLQSSRKNFVAWNDVFGY